MCLYLWWFVLTSYLTASPVHAIPVFVLIVGSADHNYIPVGPISTFPYVFSAVVDGVTVHSLIIAADPLFVLFVGFDFSGTRSLRFHYCIPSSLSLSLSLSFSLSFFFSLFLSPDSCFCSYILHLLRLLPSFFHFPLTDLVLISFIISFII